MYRSVESVEEDETSLQDKYGWDNWKESTSANVPVSDRGWFLAEARLVIA